MNNKLNKKLNKLYWKTDQHLHITTDVYFNKKTDFCADIYATDNKNDAFNKISIFLFEIQTLDNFYETIIIPEWSNKKDNEIIKTISDLWVSAHTPFYISKPYRIFTVKKFGCIDESDIRQCVKYFIRKVLNNYLIWNIDIKLEYEK